VIDYIEGVSQPLSYYVNELRSKGYERLPVMGDKLRDRLSIWPHARQIDA
jgi:hypothetical protein